MKRLAIFTWHNVDCNCGQTLQAFALQSKIVDLECYAEIIDYIYWGRSFAHNSIVWPLYKIYASVRTDRFIKQIRFDIFVKRNLNVSKALFTYEDVKKYLNKRHLSNLLLGSDQIWNPQAGCIPRVMLLEFEGGTKFSYSPSMCPESDFYIYKNEIEKVHNAILDYSLVGVREENARRMINRFGDEKEIEVMLDPVFLYDKNQWLEKLDVSGKKGNYILVYCLGEISDSIYKCIESVVNKRKVIVFSTNKYSKYPNEWNVVRVVEPRTFISYIEGASYIVTDSFHMVAFSIIFKKQFSAFTSYRKEFKSNMDRIIDLLERLNLSWRFDNGDQCNAYIDYSIYEDVIEKQIAKSQSFLQSIIKQCIE